VAADPVDLRGAHRRAGGRGADLHRPRLHRSLKAREVEGAIARPANPYEVGKKVRIAGGPFDGIVTTIIDLDEEERVVVLLDVLKRATKLTLNADGVTPV
jgi:transcriptional antiterminator RfaH